MFGSINTKQLSIIPHLVIINVQLLPINRISKNRNLLPINPNFVPVDSNPI